MQCVGSLPFHLQTRPHSIQCYPHPRMLAKPLPNPWVGKLTRSHAVLHSEGKSLAICNRCACNALAACPFICKHGRIQYSAIPTLGCWRNRFRILGWENSRGLTRCFIVRASLLLFAIAVHAMRWQLALSSANTAAFNTVLSPP